MPAMKIILSQSTSAGTVSIGNGTDGRFHVLWDGSSVASAPTVAGALEMACGRTWKPEGAGGPARPVRVSTSAEHWFLAA